MFSGAVISMAAAQTINDGFKIMGFSLVPKPTDERCYIEFNPTEKPNATQFSHNQ